MTFPNEQQDFTFIFTRVGSYVVRKSTAVPADSILSAVEFSDVVKIGVNDPLSIFHFVFSGTSEVPT